MGGVVRFTEASTIAMHTMALLAVAPDRPVTVGEVAARLPISENHLAKVLQRLARAGLVASARGPGGGFSLRVDPAKVTLLDVHEAIEGRFEVTGCLFSPAHSCAFCILGDTTREANELVRSRLAGTRLVDLVAPPEAPGPRLVPLGGEKTRPGKPAQAAPS